jgi:hypothetical protein
MTIAYINLISPSRNSLHLYRRGAGSNLSQVSDYLSEIFRGLLEPFQEVPG